MTHKTLCKVCEKLISIHTDTDLKHCNLVLTLMFVIPDEITHKKAKAVK